MSFVEKFLDLLLGEGRNREPDNVALVSNSEPEVHYEDIPGSLDLGWRYSEDRNEFQMAKVDSGDRATHMYVIGATGSGKTKFLEFLIQQDIKGRNGFAVIDPHGDLIEDIKGALANSYDENELAERVILIDPTDKKLTVTFNPLEKSPGTAVAEEVNELIASFRKIWSDSWGARMEDLMRNSMIALSEAGYTLVDLPIFLSRRAFRETVMRKVTHPVALEYFTRFEAMTDRAQVTWTEPVMNKVNALLSDERIRQIFSAPQSSFNIRGIIDSKSILLIKLDRGKLKDSADLLGSLLMSKIQMAAFSRGDLPQRKRTPFYLYIDEFQNFATESFSIILSEARKYGLSLVMAHQTLAQIPDELRSLILGNAALQVFFRINRQDASLLAKESFTYSGYEVKSVRSLNPVYWSLGEEWEKKTEELQNLQPRFCYVKHKVRGGLILIQTTEIEEPWVTAGMAEDEFESYMESLPIGNKYLRSRADLSKVAKERQENIYEELRVREAERRKFLEPRPTPVEKPVPEPMPTREAPVQPERKTVPRTAGTSGEKVETQHRYLQNLVKKMAEAKGYRATIEAPTPDGMGRVDVLLEKENERIACEISVTTDEVHELENIKKCLASGYGEIIVCAEDRKKLEKIRKLASDQMEAKDQPDVLFFTPEELMSYFTAKDAREVFEEQKIKGYNVTVRHPGGDEPAKSGKRRAVADVIMKSVQRLKNEK
ncbi:MAG: type IV secretion system DNA-binding domain-containing protein [Bacteroidetes bacterium]|nr:type IV secretion system DNA-binding domain-containing protein [Bacteroidota bacterium]